MNRKIVLPAVFLLICVAAIYWVGTRPTPKAPTVPITPAIVPQKSAAELWAELDAFFGSDVQPCIVEANKLNREAAERCVTRLEETFDGYRTGIRPFCKEINTWGTRFGVVRRMPTDWWYEKAGVADFIQTKFAKHLFTDAKLTADIESALAQFRQDIEANQNAMISKIRASVTSQDIPGLPEIDYSEFAKDLTARLTDYSTQAAKDSVVRGIVTEVASGVGGAVAQVLVSQVVTRISAMVATTSVAASGATGVATVAGGGGGSTVGPVGTAIGVGVGLAVGIVIDWWMSSNFEAKMTNQLSGLIDELNKEVIEGALNRTGLRKGLRASCDVMQQAYQDSLHSRIVDGATN